MSKEKFGGLCYGEKSSVCADKSSKRTKHITRDFIQNSIKDFLKSGGKITKVVLSPEDEVPVWVSPNSGPEDIDVKLMYEDMTKTTCNLARDIMCRDRW